VLQLTILESSFAIIKLINKDTKVPYEDSKAYVKYLKNGKLYKIPGAGHGFHEKWEYDIAEKVTVDFFCSHQ
jgi:pimeloyl-ACP methyl ester carboxylesterase